MGKPRDLPPLEIDKATARELLARVMPEHEHVLHSVVSAHGDATALGVQCSCDTVIYLTDEQLREATGWGPLAWKARLKTLCRVDRAEA